MDQYLLKPIRPHELNKAIVDMGQRIEVDKQRISNPGYDSDEVHYALRQHFMQQLPYGGLNTSTLLEKARSLKIDVVSPCYQLALFSFGPEADYHLLQITVQHLMARLEMPLHYFTESNQLTVLCDGQDEEQLSEKVFRFTTLGLYTQTVGINQRAARLNGINPMMPKWLKKE